MTFQFTPLREGRREKVAKENIKKDISIHAPARGATSPQSLVDDLLKFQFTPLREGRPLQRWKHNHICGHFNSRPCERGDWNVNGLWAAGNISIHAPARGATGQQGGPTVLGGISIHAPARGATPTNIHEYHDFMLFQFTPLREGRPNSICGRFRSNAFQFTPLREGRRRDRLYPAGGCPISIHAPARGATGACGGRSGPGNFNSRPCERGDQPEDGRN